MIVRGCHFAFDAGEGAALATLYYPGDERRLGEARLTGQVPALETAAPWPVVVMMPGINVAADGYRWLARRLVAEGLCVVTYAAIGSLGPAGRGITPGIDLSALSPGVIGTRPPSTVLGPLLSHLRGGPAPANADAGPAASGADPANPSADDSGLADAARPVAPAKPPETSQTPEPSARHRTPATGQAIGATATSQAAALSQAGTVKPGPRSAGRLNVSGAAAPSQAGTVVSVLEGTPAAGLVDLDRVVLGGHSAGGTVALHSSDPAWVPSLRAVFTYGAHTMTASGLGHGEGTVLPVPAGVPVMLLAGTNDGVIAASRDRYQSGRGADESGADFGHDPVRRTFEEAIGRRRGDSWLVELSGAGHFAICWPVDTTSGRSYLEHGDPAAGEGGYAARPFEDGVRDGRTALAVRKLLGDLIAAFVATALGRRDATDLERLTQHPSVNHWDRR